jgi:hypothetical protein
MNYHTTYTPVKRIIRCLQENKLEREVQQLEGEVTYSACTSGALKTSLIIKTLPEERVSRFFQKHVSSTILLGII